MVDKICNATCEKIRLLQYLHVCMHVHSQSLCHDQLFETPWTKARLAPMSVGFSRQEYWSGLPFPPSGGFPDPEIESASSGSPVWQADSLPLSPRGSPVFPYKIIRELFYMASQDRHGFNIGISFDDFSLTYKEKFKQLELLDN